MNGLKQTLVVIFIVGMSWNGLMGIDHKILTKNIPKESGQMVNDIVKKSIVDLCQTDDVELNNKRKKELKEIEHDYQECRHKAQKLIENNRKNGIEDLDLESKLKDMLNSYDNFSFLMEKSPSSCDEFIEDLKQNVCFFQNYLDNYHKFRENI